MRDCQSGTIYLDVMNRPTSLASSTNDITNLMIFENLSTAPLNLSTGSSSEIYMCAPARLRDLVLFKY